MDKIEKITFFTKRFNFLQKYINFHKNGSEKIKLGSTFDMER